MKKKLLTMLLAAAMAVTMLVGCGGASGDDSASGADAQISAQEEAEDAASAVDGALSGEGKKVTALFLSLEGEYFTYLDTLLEEEMTSRGYEYESQSSNMDDVTMIEQIENAVAGGTDAIWTWCVNGDVIADALKAARAQGVYVYSFIQNPGEDACDIFRGTDETVCGQTIAKMAFAWADEKYPDAAAGSIKTVVIGNEDSTGMKERTDALVEALKADGRFEVMENVLTEMSVVSSQTTTENMFNKYEDIDCIATVGGEFVLGVSAYLTSESCPLDDPTSIGVVGAEINTELAEYMRQGIYKGAAVNGGNITENIAQQAVELDSLMQGETMEKFSAVDIGECTIDNLEEFGY